MASDSIPEEIKRLTNRNTELEVEVARLVDALKFYASEFNYGPISTNAPSHIFCRPIDVDLGKVARDALNRAKGEGL